MNLTEGLPAGRRVVLCRLKPGLKNSVAMLMAATALMAAVLSMARIAQAQGLSTTTVQGSVYMANGQPGTGTLSLQWPTFTTAAGQAVAAGSLNVKIGSDGFLSVNLAPNQGAYPGGQYYTAVYYLSDGSTSTEYWVVPATATASLAQVRSQVMPATLAVQAVNKAYVDQSIAKVTGSLLTASGGTLTGPLYLSGDPSQASQAASKHYVDAAVGSASANALPLSGGNLTGPIAGVGANSEVNWTISNAGDFEGHNVSAKLIGGIPQADQFDGVDMCAKVRAAALYALANGINQVDATHFSGNQACSVDMFGAISAANPFTNINLSISFGSVHIQSTVQQNIGNSGVSVHGMGPMHTSIEYVGGATASAVLKIAPSAPSQTIFLSNIGLDGILLYGGRANVTDGLLVVATVRSQFSRVWTWGVTGCGIHTQHAVTNTFMAPRTSIADAQVLGISTHSTPTSGLCFDQLSAGLTTTDGTVIDAAAEGVSGVGWVLSHAQGMTFTSGTSEANGGGAMVGSLADGCQTNSFIDSDFEGNSSGNDFTDNGYSTTIINSIMSSSGATPSLVLGSSSQSAKIFGGLIVSSRDDSGSKGYSYDLPDYVSRYISHVSMQGLSNYGLALSPAADGGSNYELYGVNAANDSVSWSVSDMGTATFTTYANKNGIILPSGITGPHGGGTQVQLSDGRSTSGNLVKWAADGSTTDGPTPPSGAIVGTTDAQILTNKSIAGSEINSGTVGTTFGGTGIDSHASSGVAQVNGGVWSVSSNLSNGTTASTPPANDNSTKIATTAYVNSPGGIAPTTVMASGMITGGNDSTRTTSTTMTNSWTTTGLVLPAVPVSTTKSGHCTIYWQMSSTSFTATLGLGMNSAPTNVWGGTRMIYAASGTSNWLAFTQSNTATTAISAATTAGATGMTYAAQIDFVIQTGSSNPVTMTLYGQTSNSGATLTILPGSTCYWLP